MERRHQIQPSLLRELHGMFACLVEIPPVLDQGGAERAHGGVLFTAIAVRNQDRNADAGAMARKGQALAVVAAGGADDARDLRPLAAAAIHENEAAANLEGADWGVILMLDPNLGTGAHC